MTEHFLKHLEKEISLAKRAGKYDQGIKTVSGHSVVIDKPHSFCFRDLEAKDGCVLLYRVKADHGINSETALQIYNEAKGLEGETDNSPTTVSPGG